MRPPNKLAHRKWAIRWGLARASLKVPKSRYRPGHLYLPVSLLKRNYHNKKIYFLYVMVDPTRFASS